MALPCTALPGGARYLRTRLDTADPAELDYHHRDRTAAAAGTGSGQTAGLDRPATPAEVDGRSVRCDQAAGGAFPTPTLSPVRGKEELSVVGGMTPKKFTFLHACGSVPSTITRPTARVRFL